MSLFVPFFKCRLNHFRLAPKFSDSAPENALSSAGFPGHGRAASPALTLLVVVWRGVPGPRPPVARCLCPHEPRGRWPSGPLSPQKNDRGELSVHREFSYGSEVTLGGWTGKRRASGCVFRRLLRTLTSTNTHRVRVPAGLGGRAGSMWRDYEDRASGPSPGSPGRVPFSS